MSSGSHACMDVTAADIALPFPAQGHLKVTLGLHLHEGLAGTRALMKHCSHARVSSS